MSEAGYVELPILQWLSGQGSAAPGDKGLGWTYRDEAAMAAFNRPLKDPLVEKLLVEAILRLNDYVKTPEQAKLAIKALRTTMDAPDKLTANRETLDRLRDGVKVELAPGEGARTVFFIAFEPGRQHLNDYTATNQYRVQGVKQCRDDTVLLVNGISAGGRRIQELSCQRQGLEGGGASTAPLPAPGAADAHAQCILRSGGRGCVPIRHGAVPRRIDG